VTAPGDECARQIGPRPGARGPGRRPLEGARPIGSADDLVCEGVFESDEELEEFLEFTYAARRADIA
jgi:hypothetical protein